MRRGYGTTNGNNTTVSAPRQNTGKAHAQHQTYGGGVTIRAKRVVFVQHKHIVTHNRRRPTMMEQSKHELFRISVQSKQQLFMRKKNANTGERNDL